jgi:CheY-like chemotaxis protein
MPGITGAEVVDQMRRQLDEALPPLVLVTGREDAPSIAQQLGAVAYLQKPFDVDQLVALVTRLTQTE